MKNFILLLLLSAFFFACKDSNNSQVAVDKSAEVPAIDYPEAIDKIFTNHGTLETWKSMKIMSYEIVKEEGNESQMIDLESRKERIKASTFESGYDGTNYWVVADTSYKSNPKFYTNLIFYFYAMPFVLADEGIVYTKSEPLNFEGKDYPGYRISYNTGVGISPEDEYFIHYDPETYEMAWLGYTVTFFTGAKSDQIKWIRYNDWKDVSGLKLPNSLSWYKTEEGKITELRNTREFTKVVVSNQKLADDKFTMPESAKVFE